MSTYTNAISLVMIYEVREKDVIHIRRLRQARMLHRYDVLVI